MLKERRSTHGPIASRRSLRIRSRQEALTRDEGLPKTLADGLTKAKGIHHCKLSYFADGYSEVADSTQVRRFFGNKHGTLDKRELAGRLSAKELAAADPDRDGTLTADEYLAVVEQRFNAANPDADGTLDAKELNTAAGRALLRLLR